MINFGDSTPYPGNSLHSFSRVQQGKALSTAGPSRYQGDILDDPDMLWSDDHWDENRIKEAVARLRQDQGDTTGCSAFWREHYVHRAGTYWHEFYKRNVDHFYKDRHYLHIVFPELLGCGSDGTLRMMEVGSGVGNAIFPLLETNRNLQVFAFDFARAAIDIMKSNELYIQLNSSVNEGNFRVLGQVCDVVNDEIPLDEGSMDLVLCMFVLSAIAPEQHEKVLTKLSRVLKPGGKLLIRDYGRYDEAQLRFSSKSKLEENFYVRQDGTCAYYFTTDEVEAIATGAGLVAEECDYVFRQYANRKQAKARYRVWLHAKLVKIKHL